MFQDGPVPNPRQTSTIGIVSVRKHLRRKSANLYAKSLTYCFPGHKQTYEGKRLTQSGIAEFLPLTVSKKAVSQNIYAETNSESETETDIDCREIVRNSEYETEADSELESYYDPAFASDLFKVY